MNGGSSPGDGGGPLTRNRNFLLLLTGQLISQIGDRLAMVALPWLVYKTTGSALGTGMVFALYTLPYVFFGAFAGVALDRFNKRTLMLLADVARAGLIILVPLAAQQSLALVYVLAFLAASAAVVFDPGRLALIPDIVPEDKLIRANSFMTMAENLTEIVGYAGAGFMLVYVSTTSAFRIDALSFLASAVALAFMRYRPPTHSARSNTAASMWREIGEGLLYLLRNRGLLVNTAMVMGSVIGMGMSYPLTFLFAVRILNGGTRAFGLLEAFMGIGYLSGSVALAATATRVRKGPTMVVGMASMGICLVLVPVTDTTWLASAVFAVFGVANAVALVTIDTYLQQIVPNGLRGRVFGVRFTLTQSTWALSVLIGSALAGWIDIRALFIIAGVVVAVPAVLGLFAHEVRDA